MNKIVKRKIADLIPYANNAKEHTPKQIENLKKSLTEFGWVCPCVIKNNVLIVGHGRIQAAKELGWEYAECIERNDLTDEQADAYRLLDNLLSEGGYDGDKIKTELQKVDISGYDFSEIPSFIKGITDEGEYKAVEIEEANEVAEEDAQGPRTKLGNVWKLGKHLLICGDSTDKKTFERLMGEEKAEMLFTSPPYSDMREYNGDKDLSVLKIAQFITATRDYAKFLCVNLGLQRKDREIYPYWDDYIDVAHQNGLKVLAWNVWDKLMCGSIGQQSAFIPIRHEWIFVFGEKPKELNLTWEKRKSSIYSFNRERTVRQADGSMKLSTCGVSYKQSKKMESVLKGLDKETIDSVTEQKCEQGDIRKKHPATFPVYLPSEYIIALTDEDDIVIEPFGGSGTTLIACEQLKRKCRCVELDESYCDVIIERWEEYTGQKAVLINE